MFGLSAFGMWFTVWGASVIGTALFHLQHSCNTPYRVRQKTWNPAKAALEGSTYLQVPSYLRSFTNGIEYHHIHHLNTNVASYAIGDCHHDFEKVEG
jgi:omega-6 fatty acid desaturase (delta-12 desaturase)